MTTASCCIQAVFLTAVEQQTPATRGTMLGRECVGDDELRRQVTALLIAHDRPHGLLDRPLIVPGEPGEGIAGSSAGPVPSEIREDSSHEPLP